MAITSTLLASGGANYSSFFPTTSQVTATASPSSVSQSMVLAAVAMGNGTSQSLGDPVVDGWGLTWTKVQSVGILPSGNLFTRLTLFYSSGTAVPGAASTIHFPGTTQIATAEWCFVGLGGVSTGSPIVQSTYNATTVLLSTASTFAVNLVGVSTDNASFGTFLTNTTAADSTGSGFSLVYANSIISDPLAVKMNFLNEIALAGLSVVPIVIPGRVSRRQGIAVEISGKGTPNPIAHLTGSASVTAALSLVQRLTAPVAATALLTATLTRTHLNSLTAPLTGSAVMTATLTVGRVTRFLILSVGAGASLTATLAPPIQAGRAQTTRQYILQGSLRMETDGFPPMSRVKSFRSSASPRTKFLLDLSTTPAVVDLTAYSNTMFVMLIPQATNTLPIHLAQAPGDDGLVLSSVDASWFAVGAPTTGFNLFTSIGQTQVRVGIY